MAQPPAAPIPVAPPQPVPQSTPILIRGSVLTTTGPTFVLRMEPNRQCDVCDKNIDQMALAPGIAYYCKDGAETGLDICINCMLTLVRPALEHDYKERLLEKERDSAPAVPPGKGRSGALMFHPSNGRNLFDVSLPTTQSVIKNTKLTITPFMIQAICDEHAKKPVGTPIQTTLSEFGFDSDKFDEGVRLCREYQLSK